MDLFEKDPDKSDELKFMDVEFTYVFCMVHQLIPLLNDIPNDKYELVYNYIRNAFRYFHDICPYSALTEREGICMIANMQLGIPGTIGMFTRRILPYSFLKNTFFDLLDELQTLVYLSNTFNMLSRPNST